MDGERSMMDGEMPSLVPEAAGAKRKATADEHWSKKSKGESFSILVENVPTGDKTMPTASVSIMMRRNEYTGLTESAEPGWDFTTKGARSSPLQTAPRAPCSACQRLRRLWRLWWFWRRPLLSRLHGRTRCSSYPGQGRRQEALHAADAWQPLRPCTEAYPKDYVDAVLKPGRGRRCTCPRNTGSNLAESVSVKIYGETRDFL